MPVIEAVELVDPKPSSGLCGVIVEYAEEGDLMIGQVFKVNGVLVYPHLVRCEHLGDGRIRAVYQWEQPT